jgi:AraC family transcriptional regulator
MVLASVLWRIPASGTRCRPPANNAGAALRKRRQATIVAEEGKMDVGDGPATMGGRSRMTQAAVPLWRLEAAKPYHLEFENDADIVCLLLGSIDARTGYDGCHPADMRFEALTAAYHPAGGRVTVDATAVSAGFAAFAFPQALQQQMFGSDYALDRIPTSVDNITSPSIASLVAYARTVFRGIGHRDGLIVEALSQLALVDVFNCLKAVRKKTSCGPLSAREFTRLTDYVDRNIAQSLSLSELSVALDMPIVTLRRRFQRKTGLSLHQFVLERRL